MHFYKQNALYASGFLSLILLMVSTFSLSVVQQQNARELGHLLSDNKINRSDSATPPRQGALVYTAPDTSIYVDPSTSFFARTYGSPESSIITIEYDLPSKSAVKVEVYDVNKTFSKTLVNTRQEPGNYKVYFDGAEQASGLYVCRIYVQNTVWIEPMLLVK